MKLMPLAGYILIEPLESEEKTASGLVLPETARDKPAKGKVLEIGDPVVHQEDSTIRTEPAPVDTKQIVIFKKWGGQDVTEGDKELKLVKFDEIMGVYSD